MNPPKASITDPRAGFGPASVAPAARNRFWRAVAAAYGTGLAWRLGVIALIVAWHVAWAGPARAAESAGNLKAEGCGELNNAYGPFNYNTARGRKHWHVVASFHFTESVRTLQHGATGPIGQDLDYTLRAFPNQPLALYDMVVYQSRNGYPAGGNHDTVGYYSAQCYLMRAVAFAPDDGIVRMIYGIYFQREGRDADALERYKQAEKRIEPARAAELYNNMGLLYLKMKNYEKAREYAHKAYRYGYPLSGLRDRLKAVHQWSPPAAASSGAMSSGAASN